MSVDNLDLVALESLAKALRMHPEAVNDAARIERAVAEVRNLWSVLQRLRDTLLAIRACNTCPGCSLQAKEALKEDAK